MSGRQGSGREARGRTRLRRTRGLWAGALVALVALVTAAAWMPPWVRIAPRRAVVPAAARAVRPPAAAPAASRLPALPWRAHHAEAAGAVAGRLAAYRAALGGVVTPVGGGRGSGRLQEGMGMGGGQRSDGMGMEGGGAQAAQLAASVHRGLGCAQCHGGDGEGMEMTVDRAAAERSCGSCHTAAAAAFGDAHGRARAAGRVAPGCVSCHGSHAVRAIADPRSGAHAAAQPASCGSCHLASARAFAPSVHGGATRAGAAAVSAVPTCAACHGAHGIEPARVVASRVAPARVNATCGACHALAATQERVSVHARAVARGAVDAPTCASCHGAHATRTLRDTLPRGPAAASRAATWGRGMARPDSVHALGVGGALARSELGCARCHASVALRLSRGWRADVVADYGASYHGLARVNGDRRAADCVSCHQAHGVRASRDRLSPTHPANRQATCGQCHAGADPTFARGPGVHRDPGRPSGWMVAAVSGMYQGMVALVLSLMAVHNLIDFQRRLRARWARRRARRGGRPVPAGAAAPPLVEGAPPQARDEAAHDGTEARVASRAVPAPGGEATAEGDVLRFTRGERAQHWLLAASFGALTLSGFALLWHWRLPGLAPAAAETARQLVHRGAASVFLALAVWHVGYLAGTRRGRGLVRAMLPRHATARNVLCGMAACIRLGPPSVNDWRDLVQMVRYNIGLTREPPRFGRFSYAEKMEYFGLIWGGAIMAVTGLALWFEVPVLNRLPAWAADLATVMHRWEAVLAAASIVIWHFYFTIWNPDVFPLARTMLTGRMSREEMTREHPLELTPPNGESACSCPPGACTCSHARTKSDPRPEEPRAS